MPKCRACLSTEQRLVPFDDTSIDRYNLLTNLDVKESDGLPQALCEQCFNTIETFVTFRLNCINSEQILKEEYGGSSRNQTAKREPKVKLEGGKPIDDDDDTRAESFMGGDDAPSVAGADAAQVKDEAMDLDDMKESKWDNMTDLPEDLINDVELCDAVLKFDDTSESETEESGSEQAKWQNNTSNKMEIKNRYQYLLASTIWEGKEFPIVKYKLLQPSYPPIAAADFKIMNYFQQYIDDEFIATVVATTNQSYQAHHAQSLDLTFEEFRKYIGMTFIMASIKNLTLKEFWEHPFGMPIIKNTMSRRRFVTIRNSVELISEDDITEEEHKDTLWKLRPLIVRIQRGCRLQEKEQRLAVDEMIIPFTGTGPIKPYRPNERRPIGLKAYVMSNPDGLVTDIEIFEGNTTFPDYKDTDYTIREKAVLTMADSLVPGHVLYFDRYFTTEKLAAELANRGIGCTGVLRRTAIPIIAKRKLLSDDKLKLLGKGAVQCVINDRNNMAITKWFDKKVTTFLSTVEALVPIDKYERWSANLYRNVLVDRPAVARNYENYFEGSETTVETWSEFPCRHRSKSCTLRFFYHMLDLAVCNAWLQYNKVEVEKGTPIKKIKELQAYKMELGCILIRGEKIEKSDGTDEYSSSDESTSGAEDIPIFEMKGNAIVRLIEPRHN